MFAPPAIPPGPSLQIARAGGKVSVSPAGAVVIAPLAGQSTSVSSGSFTLASGALIFSASASKVVPGATSLSFRNNADSADNVLIANAGDATFRATVTAAGLIWSTVSGFKFPDNSIQTTAATAGAAAAGSLTGTTMAANVVTSSLTAVGILAAPHMTAPVVDSGGLWFSAAAAKIVPGATSISHRNNADSADNLLISDAGVVTIRNTLTVTLGTITASTPAHSSTATWNLVGTTFKHIFANITDTASATASLLVDLQVGGVSKFSVGKDGSLVATGSQNAFGAVSITSLVNLSTAFTNAAGNVVGLRISSTLTSGSGNTVTGIQGIFTVGSGSENVAAASCFSAGGLTKGTSGAITDLIGFRSPTQSAVATNAWAFLNTAAPTGGTAINASYGATMGAITNPVYAFYSTVTWNDAADTFTHIFANVTDTASAAGSLLLDFKVGGSTVFSIGKSGLVLTVASAAGGAAFRLPHGAAPTSPVDGDVWTTTAGIYVRINGATVGPLS